MLSRPKASSPSRGEDGRWGWHDGFTLPFIPSHQGRGRVHPLRAGRRGKQRRARLRLQPSWARIL